MTKMYIHIAIRSILLLFVLDEVTNAVFMMCLTR